MNIHSEILHSFNAENKKYSPGELIFREGDRASYYFQIIQGKVKLNNYNEEGKEFIHNILGDNQSFGDSLLFLNKLYPTNAMALTPTEVIRVPKNNFLELLDTYPHLSLEMNACLSQRLYFKVIMLQSMSSQNPVLRLKGVLDYLKSYHDDDCAQCFQIQLTRQQLANLTGLRVETVIRTLKKMEKDLIVKLENRKILY